MGKKLIILTAAVLSGCSAASDTEIAMIYICGYQHGQRAVVEAARLLDTPAPPARIECERFAEIAAKQGFGVAGKNR